MWTKAACCNIRWHCLSLEVLILESCCRAMVKKENNLLTNKKWTTINKISTVAKPYYSVSVVLNFGCCMHAKSLQSCLTLCNLWTIACQAPLSMGFSRQEYWSGLPCPPPGDLPDSGMKTASLMSPALAGGFFTTSANWGAGHS